MARFLRRHSRRGAVRRHRAASALAIPEPREADVHLLDFRPVLANRRALAYVLGYGVHCWELFATRSWLVAFLAFRA